MIDQVRLANYRSIVRCNVKLAPLTVLIGANGSGKSNFIKAIEFIADIAAVGLVEAVSRRGGFYELLPKALPKANRRVSTVRMEWKATLAVLEDVPPMRVDHRIRLRGDLANVRVARERLRFVQPLRFAWHLIEDAEATREPPPSSEYVFERTESGGVEYRLSPEPDEESLWLARTWFGYVDRQAETAEAMKADLDSKFEKVSSGHSGRSDQFAAGEKLRSSQTFLDVAFVSRLALPAFWHYYVNMQHKIGRYELLLHELRQPQKRTSVAKLSSEGQNMPAVLATVRRDTDSWNRILDTLLRIAPHVNTLGVKNLRDGKQFIEFLESRDGQSVESWECSDGTLRTLALLLALETHPTGGTILIEEPELGLHPWAIEYLMEYVQNLVERRGIQVIMTTHSAQVLNSVEPEQVIVTSRTAEKGTVLDALADLLDTTDLERGDIGRMWEKGLLGGVPDNAI